MALTNAQYDAIMRAYSEKQLRSRRGRDERAAEAYARIPRLAELDREAAALSLRKARLLLQDVPSGSGKPGEAGHAADFDLPAAIRDIAEERRVLLLMHGYPEDYLEARYECPLCRDTGYVDNRKCSCFRRMEIRMLYADSHLDGVLEKENFDTFDLSWYPDAPKNAKTGLTPREEAAAALETALAYTAGFGSGADSLYIYGDVGLGKTFLTHCIAKELLEKGFSVLYLSAFDLFEMLGKYHFESRDDLEEQHDALFSADLLIIDDLGTGLVNAFVSSQLFLLVSQRLLQKRATILSTNLPPEKLADSFSERTFSRIMGAYRLIHLSGKDIRIQKKLSGGA